MTYTYLFEISALVITIIVLYDYRNKNKYLKRETRMFKLVAIASAMEFFVNLLSSIMIEYTGKIPVLYNIIAATLFFVLQAAMLFSIVVFSFIYMNPHLKRKSPEMLLGASLFAANGILALTTPFTRFYFYFNESGQYMQGSGATLGYMFYLFNVLLCLGYVLYNKGHLLMKDMKVAGTVAIFVSIGFCIQFYMKTLLMLDFSVAMAILYMYMTLENPNDSMDKLTLCGNGYVFRHLIDERCDTGHTFSVIFLDIRKFSFINTTYGMETGDLLLQQVATFLEQSFPSQPVFRTHDDIFALLISRPQSQLGEYIRIIKNRFDSSWKTHGYATLTMDLLITVCEYPECFHSHAELIKLKSSMVTKQKNTLNQELLFSDKSMYDECIRRENVEHILQKALEQHTLQTYYQPIINSTTKTVESLEALSRLYDDSLGFIPPDEFISIAEANGLIIQLGFYVLENACRFIRDHLQNQPDHQIHCIHVNLSTLQCEYPHFSQKVQTIMDRYQIPAHMIQFELTESTMLHSPQRVLRTMNELHSYGILFALDDYGTGYSNISYLIQFPFHEIKFDKTIVQSCFENENAHLIMEHEFQTLTQLGKRIILEGIETRTQYEEMRKHNIFLFQGYYFSKPLPEDQCLEFLQSVQHQPENYFS